MAIRGIVGIALTVWSAIGFVALLPHPIFTGLFTESIAHAERSCIGYSCVPYDSRLTGSHKLDGAINGFLTFFYDLVEWERPDLNLVMIPFAGVALATWCLGLIQSVRYSNQGKVASRFISAGLLGQLLGFGFVLPAFLAKSLSLQPAAQTWSALGAPLHEIRAIVPTVVFGVALPLTLASLSPSILGSIETKVSFVRISMVFPAVAYVVNRIIAGILRSASDARPLSRPTKAEFGQIREAWNTVYGFALLCSAVPHVAFLSTILGTRFFGELFSPASRGFFSVERVVYLENILSLEPIQSLSDGELRFVQWDHVLISMSWLLWALGSVSPTARTLFSFSGISRLVVLTLLLGPVSAAIMLVWERDTLVMVEATFSEEKLLQQKGK